MVGGLTTHDLTCCLGPCSGREGGEQRAQTCLLQFGCPDALPPQVASTPQQEGDDSGAARCPRKISRRSCATETSGSEH